MMSPIKAFTRIIMTAVLLSVSLWPAATVAKASTAETSPDWIGLHVNRVRVLERTWVDAPDNDHPPAEMVCYLVAYLESGFTALLTYPANGSVVADVGDTINTGEVGLSLTAPRGLDEISVSVVCVDRDQDPEKFAVGQRSFTYFLTRGIQGSAFDKIAGTARNGILGIGQVAKLGGWATIMVSGVIVLGQALWDWMNENDLMGEALITLRRQDGWSADGTERTYKSTNGALEFSVEVRPSIDPTAETEAISSSYREMGKQWDAAYYNNSDLTGSPALVWSEDGINFDWASTSPAVGLVNNDGFSARWLRTVELPAGVYRFTVRADDGVRLSLDDDVFVDEWHDQNHVYMKDYEHVGGPLKILMEYYEKGGTASAKLSWERLPPTPQAAWHGEYFANGDLTGTPSLIRSDPDIDFAWDKGIPEYELGPDHYSAVWTRTANLPKGSYSFTVVGDDGIRLYLNGELSIDGWRDHAARALMKHYEHKGGLLSIRLEYYNNGGKGVAKLYWARLDFGTPLEAYWAGEYFNGDSTDEAPSLVRNDEAIDFNWGSGSPGPNIEADNFYVRWSRSIALDPGLYRFIIRADDGVRLYLNSDLVIDARQEHVARTHMVDYRHPGGPLPLLLEYFEHKGDALVGLKWEKVDEKLAGSTWRAEYYDNIELSGTPNLIRNEPAIDFAWKNGIPENGIGPSDFSARWTRTIDLEPGTYEFTIQGDDGIRLFVNGKLFMDGWREQTGPQYVKLLDHDGGPISFELEYYNRSGDGLAKLTWQRTPSAPGKAAWYGEYYNKDTQDKAPSFIHSDPVIDFDWRGESPSPAIDKDNFYVRWTRQLVLEPGLYRFIVVADDRIRLSVGATLLMDEWQSHPLQPFVQEYSHGGGSVTVVLAYYEDSGDAAVKLEWQKIDETVGRSGWRAEYYNNESLSGSPGLIRYEPQIDFNWSTGAPAQGIRADSFSTRWTQTLDLPKGSYTFSVNADDGVKLYVDRRLMIDEWHSQEGKETKSVVVNHDGGALPVELHYYEGSGTAQVHLVVSPTQE